MSWVDADPPAEEVDPVDGETEALALAQSHPSGKDDEGAVAVGDSGGQRLHLGDGEGNHFGVVALGQGDADARRRGDQPIADGGFEDGRHPAVDELDGGRRQHAGQRLDPRLDLASADGPDRPASQLRVSVQAQESLRRRRRRRSVDLGGAPLLGVVPKQRPPAGGVDVGAMGQVAADGVEEALGVALARELAGLLRPAGILPPPGPIPAVGTLVDARHGCPHPP